MSRIVILILIHHLHKPIDRINLWARSGDMFPVRYNRYPSCALIRDRTIDNVQNCESFTDTVLRRLA
jgi:hypothetical protein